MTGVATTYVALRGIDVGGHAKVAMDGLRRLFVALGHAEVRTCIQVAVGAVIVAVRLLRTEEQSR